MLLYKIICIALHSILPITMHQVTNAHTYSKQHIPNLVYNYHIRNEHKPRSVNNYVNLIFYRPTYPLKKKQIEITEASPAAMTTSALTLKFCSWSLVTRCQSSLTMLMAETLSVISQFHSTSRGLQQQSSVIEPAEELPQTETQKHSLCLLLKSVFMSADR